jgi:phosphate/phosphite/phosphonate ABC transporter binding protein
VDFETRIVLGLVPSDRLRARDPRTRALARAIGERAGVYVVERNVSSYEELETEMTFGRIDIAWLPPIVFARLERADVAVAVASRALATGTYASVLIARPDGRVSRLDQLHGTRMAWVDPLSASGYVVPRLGLLAQGIDPRRTFSNEEFAGSHAEALRAVLGKRVDVAATFANFDLEGKVLHGPWGEIGAPAEDVRIVAKLGEIPPDLIGARTQVEPALRDALFDALVAVSADPELGDIVTRVFGGRGFARGAPASYETMRDLLAQANDPALGAAASEAFATTAPPADEPEKAGEPQKT